MSEFILTVAVEEYQEKIKAYIKETGLIWGKRHNMMVKPLSIPEIRPVYIKPTALNYEITTLLISETAKQEPLGIMFYDPTGNREMVVACHYWSNEKSERLYPIFYFYSDRSPGLIIVGKGGIFPSLGPKGNAITINDYFITQQMQKGEKYLDIKEAMGTPPD